MMRSRDRHNLLRSLVAGVFLAAAGNAVASEDLEPYKMIRSLQYLQDAIAGMETPNFWDYGVELTRPARAMKLWFTLQVLGEKALGAAIDHGFALAEALEAALAPLADWQIVSAAQLGIVTFRYVPPGRGAEELDALNSQIAREMVEQNLGAPLTTKLDDMVVMRACTISPDATFDDIRAMARSMDQLAREIALRQG